MKTRHLWTYDVRPGALYHIPRVPDNVMLDLTWDCDQHCVFCYNPASDRDREGPITDMARAIIGKLADWGVREVLYLGGEPTLHVDFDGVLALGAGRGLMQKVVTNGSSIDAARARHIAELGVEVGISLHASKPDLHDRLAGRQMSFVRAMRALAALMHAGARAFVQYSPTRLDPDGLPSLVAMLRREAGDNIRLLDINRLLPFGMGAQTASTVFVGEDAWWTILRDAGNLILDGWSVRIESVPRCWVRRRASAAGIRDDQRDSILASLRPCSMGITQIALDPLGRIKLCPGGPAVGPSILDYDPEDVWRNASVLQQRRQMTFLPAACVDFVTGKHCAEFYECGGGCCSATGGASVAADPLTC